MRTFCLKNKKSLPISYKEFAAIAELVSNVICEFRPHVHQYVRVNQNTSLLLRRQLFTTVLSEDAWARANKVQLVLSENETCRMHFTFTMSLDRTNEKDTIYFREECIEADLSVCIKEALAELKRTYRISDGYPPARMNEPALGTSTNLLVGM